VRVRLRHRAATVNLNKDQLSVRGDTLCIGHTQQADHCYGVTHFQDSFFLARNIDRQGEMGTLRVIIDIFHVGAENKWYASTPINESAFGQKLTTTIAGVEPRSRISIIGRIGAELQLKVVDELSRRTQRRIHPPELNCCSSQRGPPANVHNLVTRDPTNLDGFWRAEVNAKTTRSKTYSPRNSSQSRAVGMPQCQRTRNPSCRLRIYWKHVYLELRSEPWCRSAQRTEATRPTSYVFPNLSLFAPFTLTPIIITDAQEKRTARTEL